MADDLLRNWLLEKLSRELAEEYERIQAELKAKPENNQLSGYLAEAVWARLLAEWLPPQYDFGFQRRLLFEQAVDGKWRSGEMDLVLFHPSYPKRLRDEHEVLISGVVAAFSVKLNMTGDGLREAIEMAAELRRGLMPRIGEPIGDLVSPLVVGVLAQSHRELGQTPEETVGKTLLDAARQLDGSGAYPPYEGADYLSTAGLATHPRNELDFVCVADLNCWYRQPLVLWQEMGLPWAEDDDKYVAHWISRNEVGPDSHLAEPIAMLVSELWQKLANRDQTLKAIADGFRSTGTPGTRAEAPVGLDARKSLRPLVDDRTYAALRSSPSFYVAL